MVIKRFIKEGSSKAQTKKIVAINADDEQKKSRKINWNANPYEKISMKIVLITYISGRPGRPYLILPFAVYDE